MTSARSGLLESRGAAVASVIFFSCLAVWAWTTITSAHHLERDPIYLGGLVFSMFVTVSVAFRSPLPSDRIAFAAAAVAALLAIVGAIVPLGPGAMVVANGARASMWTVAAVVGLVVLVRGHPPRRQQE